MTANQNRKIKPYIEVAPVVILIMFTVISGISGAFLQSLGWCPSIGMRTLTLEYYREVLGSRVFKASLFYTVKICTISSLVSLVIGVFLTKCILIFRSNRVDIFRIPVIIPHITVALFAITWLSDTGLAARILYALGVENAEKIFGNLLFSSSGMGVIFSYIWKEVPFVILSTHAILTRISDKHEMAAMNLGASGLYAFFRVTLPMLMPTITSVFNIIFAFSFGAYELPALIGATLPKALPVQVFNAYKEPVWTQRPYAMVYSILLVMGTLFFLTVFNLIARIVVKGGVGRKNG